MVKVKASTQKGRNMVWNYQRYKASTLGEIYGRWSNAKEQAYNWCREQFANDEHATGFRVGGATSTAFNACWLTEYEGKSALRYETYKNSYIVILAE